MIGGQRVEFDQHDAHRRIRDDGDHIFRASGHSAQRAFNSLADHTALPQIVLDQVGDNAAGCEFVRRTSFEPVSVVDDAPGQNPIRRNLTSQPRLGSICR